MGQTLSEPVVEKVSSISPPIVFCPSSCTVFFAAPRGPVAPDSSTPPIILSPSYESPFYPTRLGELQLRILRIQIPLPSRRCGEGGEGADASEPS